MLNNKYSLTFNGKYYRLNLEKINKFCLTSSEKKSNEREITEGYETDENGEFRLSSKINREITTGGNEQEDAIMYDFVKMLISSLFSNEVVTTSDELHVNVSFALVFNTLLSEGMIEEITN